MFLKGERGFTLVELLASIVILTIILTVFLRFFAQAAFFATKNEEMLTSSNDARAVLTLIQENDRKNYILHDELQLLNNPMTANQIITIEDDSIISQLLYPWKEEAELLDEDKFIIQNTELHLKKGPENLIEAEVTIRSSRDSSKVLSTTYGFLTNKYQFNLRDIPITSESGVFHLRTNDNIGDVFSQPENTAIAIQIKNFAKPYYPTSKTEGDLVFMNIRNDVDEFSINTTFELITPHKNGGFGILVDGIIPTTTNSTEVKENGYMLVFKPNTDNTLKTVELYLRENGLNFRGSITPLEAIDLSGQFEEGDKLSLEGKISVEILVENFGPENPTRRKYTVILKQGESIQTIPLTFGNHSVIDLKNISGYSSYEKYIGLRLWSNSDDELQQNTLRIYR